MLAQRGSKEICWSQARYWRRQKIGHAATRNMAFCCTVAGQVCGRSRRQLRLGHRLPLDAVPLERMQKTLQDQGRRVFLTRKRLASRWLKKSSAEGTDTSRAAGRPFHHGP